MPTRLPSARSIATITVAVALLAACSSSSSKAPELSVSPATLDFAAPPGVATPPAQVLTVANAGGGTLAAPTTSITYVEGAGWLAATVSGTSAPYTVTVQPSAGALAAGTFHASISIASDGAGGSPRTVAVTLVKTAPTPTFTLHYHRALKDYAGWTAQVSAGAAEASAAWSTTDGFGAVYTLTVNAGAPTLAFTLENGGVVDAAGPLTVDVSGAIREVWVFSGWAEAIPRRLPAIPSGPNQVALYYVRPDGLYTGWGLHLWGDQVNNTAWTAPLAYVGTDPTYGAGFLVNVAPGAAAGGCQVGEVCFIVHKGDAKDPGPDMVWDRAKNGDIIFVTSGRSDITSAPIDPNAPSVAGAAAHLLARDTVAWREPSYWSVGSPATTFELRWSATAEIQATATDVVGGTSIPLTPRAAGLTAAQQLLVPHLQTWRAFDVAPADLPALEQALKGQVVAVARRADGTVFAATQLQTAFGLDDLYGYDGPLGVAFATVAGAPTFRLWAPTAQAVTLHVYDAAKAEVASLAMSPGAQGVWSHAGPAAWYGNYYQYELDVYHPLTKRIEHLVTTDPYAVNLSTNGAYAQVVDLADPALAPPGWSAVVKPGLAAFEDIVIYESHIRDFSVQDSTAPASRRGKYLGFVTEPAASRSDGLAHLKALADVGLTHIHLLPAFDIATVDEDPANRVDLGQPFAELCAKNTAVPVVLCGQHAGRTIAEAMATYSGAAEEPQAIAGYMAGYDAFNWGYDPLHYGAPEGSYASTAEGTERIVEFRRMVMGLADLGLRTVMDVVYNHTTASGTGNRAVLDKAVPGYYHRLDEKSGFVLTSSCCANTATEHRMMGRLMTDTLVRWARDYKVDGFRFDLMGLHLKADILRARDALAALTPGTDGVDGGAIYLYGEGWNMGETVDGTRGTNASQANMAGTGIGTFNDRIRDAARGGGPFDAASDLRRNQGLSTGLFLDPNELNAGAAAERTKLLQAGDLIKVGMAGSLKDFRLINQNGSAVQANQIGYNGARAGYTLDPQEAINYSSAHDNQTLWDIQQYKQPTGRATATRVRSYLLALDVIALGQGIPFFHMGDDLLRSKSMERDSYDSGDWFNRLDWTGQTSAWRSGKPNQGKDGGNWLVIEPIFADATATPAAQDIAATRTHFRELLQIRRSSGLFRLGARAEVMKRVDFLNVGAAQVPGLIVMTVSDGTCAGADLDPALDGLVVAVNADLVSHDVTVPGATGAVLHPVQAASPDTVVHGATILGEVITVPPRTTAVFQLPQGGAQGAGLPCNAR